MQIQTTTGRPYPIGVSYYDNGVNFSFPCEQEDCGLILYQKGSWEEIQRIPFPKEGIVGRLHTMFVQGIDRKKTAYRFYVKEVEVVDEAAHAYYENRKYGTPRTDKLYCGFLDEKYSWEGDVSPRLSYEESIVYCLHVRGFTAHSSSKTAVGQRGTFQGVCKKIPYLQELGVTTLELQPAYEFDELEEKNFAMSAYAQMAMQKKTAEIEPEYQLNYWGYKKGRYYSPKRAYTAGEDSSSEFRNLVKELHKNRMEVIMQFYFPDHFPHQTILDILRFWVLEYHVDGFHLKGSGIPASMLLRDPGLCGTKLWLEQEIPMPQSTDAGFWNDGAAEYGGAYRDDMRRFLKGDEGSLSAALYQMREKQGMHGRINYLSNYEGFTLMDMVSYDRKHNEANGEFNKDGSNFNYSWNCGEEGSSRKKAVKALRLKQIKNALCMLYLSQGTPLLFMGDEFGNTQSGNNNPYCQDNEITWLNWRLLKTHDEIYRFTKEMIAFRKKYKILHMKNGLRLMDYKACGYPDLSYHSEEAWHPQTENYIRHTGMMYCCRYADETIAQQLLYVAVNMHWEEHEFGLPKVLPETEWMTLFTTSGSTQEQIQSEKKLCVPDRSITVLAGMKKVDGETE